MVIYLVVSKIFRNFAAEIRFAYEGVIQNSRLFEP